MAYKQIRSTYVCVIIVCLLVALSAGGRCLPSAFADTGEYTSAITDLQKDESFNAADYPSIANDYTIQVIQIAESTRGELFVYTYQPCQEATKLAATKINMSLSDSPDGTKLNALTLVSSEGVFCKYKVDLFVVSTALIRYYNITSIYRKFISGVDKESGTDNTINGFAFAVGKCYKVTTENGKVTYECKAEDVVQIINPYAGFLEYFDGYRFCGWKHCHGHFVAFSADKQIDRLVQADVSYTSQKWYKKYSMTGGTQKWYDEPVNGNSTVNGVEKGGNDGGFLAQRYEWDRIQTVADFIAQEDLTDAMKNSLKGAQWVLRFTETRRRVAEEPLSTKSILYWTEVTEVSVLRLKFMTNGRVYNLGAVSNEVTGSGKPGNINTDEMLDLWDWLTQETGVPQWVWKTLFSVVVIAVVLLVLSLIFPPFAQIMLVVLKGIWWVICAPFKGIAALVQKIKDKKDGV